MITSCRNSYGGLCRNLYPLQRHEINLLDTLRWHGNIIDQAFSRYWIDAVLSRNTTPAHREDREFSYVKPTRQLVTREGINWLGLPMYFLDGAQNALTFEPGNAKRYQVTVDIALSKGALSVSDGAGKQFDQFLISDIKKGGIEGYRYITVERDLPAGVETLTMGPADNASQLTIGDLGVLGSRPWHGADPRTPFVLEVNTVGFVPAA